jgi:hypothetical protein
VVKQLKEQSLLSFLEEMPHVEAASRVSFSNLKETSNQLSTGLKQVQEELRHAVHDRFRSVMEVRFGRFC